MTDLEVGKTYEREIIYGRASGIYKINVLSAPYTVGRRKVIDLEGKLIKPYNERASRYFRERIPTSVILDPPSSYGGSRYRVKYSKKRSKRRSTKRKSTKRKSIKRRSKQRKYKKTRRRK